MIRALFCGGKSVACGSGKGTNCISDDWSESWDDRSDSGGVFSDSCENFTKPFAEGIFFDHDC